MKSLVDAVISVINISTVAGTLLNALNVLNLGSRWKYFLAESPAKGSSYPVTCHTLSIAQVPKEPEIVHPILHLSSIAYLASLTQQWILHLIPWSLDFLHYLLQGRGRVQECVGNTEVPF